MDRRFLRNRNQNLFTIDEGNENSLLQSSIPKESLINYNLQKDHSNKENIEFTKLPKFLTSKINKGKDQSNTMNKNIHYTPNYSSFQSSVKPQNNYNTSDYFVSELFSKRKNLTNKSYRLIITNFPYNSTQKILNELKKFGEMKEYYFIENSSILVIEYENYLNAFEAAKNFNVNLIDKTQPITIEITPDEENFINQNHYDRMERKDRRDISKDISRINPPNVSYLNHIIDFIFNW